MIILLFSQHRWPWLGGWADLGTPEGLQHLEEHLERRQGEQQLRERIAEVESEDGDEVFENGEYENEDNVNLGEVELALSPLSSLSKTLDSLSLRGNLDNLDNSQVNANTQNSTIIVSELEQQDNSSDIKVIQTVRQFCGLVAPLLADRLPEVVGDHQAAEWGLEILPHWLGLRRQVNNWRSDPAQRYETFKHCNPDKRFFQVCWSRLFSTGWQVGGGAAAGVGDGARAVGDAQGCPALSRAGQSVHERQSEKLRNYRGGIQFT